MATPTRTGVQLQIEQTPWQKKISVRGRRLLVDLVASDDDATDLSDGFGKLALTSLAKQDPEARSSPLSRPFQGGMIMLSKHYNVSSEWTTNIGEDEFIDMAKVYRYLPEFIHEIKVQSTASMELESCLQIVNDEKEMPGKNIFEKLCTSSPGPYTRERIDKLMGETPQSHTCEESHYSTWIVETPSEHTELLYLDCEYILKVSVPKLENFKRDFIEAMKNPQSKRWIFVPSYLRANCILIEWIQKERIENTYTILVVRPSEFDKYRKSRGRYMPIICLPRDEFGAGYPRYWIQKFATYYKMNFIWMIDDDVPYLEQYRPPEGKGKKGKCNDASFEYVFTEIEKLTGELIQKGDNLVAISPRRFSPYIFTTTKEFARKSPQCAVYLNLELLKEKGVHYRPDLPYLEDMVFGYECEQKGLSVCRWNRFVAHDKKFRNTGAHAYYLEMDLEWQKKQLLVKS